jgi:hypothetical protein
MVSATFLASGDRAVVNFVSVSITLEGNSNMVRSFKLRGGGERDRALIFLVQMHHDHVFSLNTM